MITKAIIPVAGWGTRRLPITKIIEKSMLPVGNRPLVDYSVQELIKAGVKDIYMIRSKLEGLCAYWATFHITNEQMEELEENIYLSKFHAKKGHSEQIAELDNRFHEVLYEACNSKMLEHQLRDFHDYVLRVRKKTLSQFKRSSESTQEHEMIFEAIKNKQPQEAERLANLHIVNAYKNMVQNGLYEVYGQDAPKEDDFLYGTDAVNVVE